MNTKSKQNQKNLRQQKQRPKKQGQNHNTLLEDRKYHDQELPETRLTR
jgi:hypothetical protein